MVLTGLRELEEAAGEVSIQLYQRVLQKNALPGSLGKFAR